MDARQQRALASLERVRDFLDDLSTAGLVPADDGQRQSLAERIGQIRAAAETLARVRDESPAEVRRVRELRRALASDHVLRVTRVARTVLFPVDVDDGLLRPPTRRLSPAALVKIARALADAVTPHRPLFLEAGLPADFVEQLRAAADAYRAAMDARAEHRRQRARAAAQLREELGRGRVLLGRIDALLTVLLRDDRIRLAEWRRVKRAPRGSRADEDPGLLSLEALAQLSSSGSRGLTA
jgi:hypothetical protein